MRMKLPCGRKHENEVDERQAESAKETAAECRSHATRAANRPERAGCVERSRSGPGVSPAVPALKTTGIPTRQSRKKHRYSIKLLQLVPIIP